MKRSAEFSSPGISPVEHMPVVAETASSEIEGMRSAVVEALQDHYRNMGFGSGDDTRKFHTAIGFIADPSQADVKESLMTLVGRFGHNPNSFEDLHTYLFPLQVAAFDQTYVEHAVNAVLEGHELTTSQHVNQARTFGLIRSHLLMPVAHREGQHLGPRHHYPELSHTIWTGRRTALRDELHSEADQIHSIHKAIRPAVEHPTIRAVSLAADITDKIEHNQRFNLNELRKLSREVAAEVAPGVRRYSETADQIFTAFIGQAVERQLHHLQQGNIKAANYYEKILETMRVEVEIVAKFAGPETPADAFGEAVVDDILQEEYGPDTSFNDIYTDPQVEVFTDPKTTRHQRAKVTVLTTAASAAVLTAASPFFMQSHPQQQYTPDISAAEKGSALYVVPNPGTESSKVSDEASNLAPNGAVIEPQTDPLTLAESMVESPDISEAPDLEPPKSYEEGGNPDRPTAQDVKNIGSLPVIGMVEHATAQTHTPELSPQKSKEYLKNFDYNGTFAQAKKAYTDAYLSDHPDAAVAADTVLASNADQMIGNQIAKLKEYHGAGKLNTEAYEAAHQLLLKAAVASAYPGLIQDLGLDELKGTEYTNALLTHYLQTSGNLGNSADTSTLNTVSLAIAGAIELITPADAQAAYLQSVGIEPEVATEETSTNGNKHENKGDDQQGETDNGSKQDEEKHDDTKSEEDGGKNTDTITPENKYQLSDAEKTALTKMENMGPEWHNRALVMRGLMERGRTAMVASGIIGNASVEAAGTELNPAITQIGGGPGRGIIQWEVGGRFGTIGETDAVGTLVWYAAQNKVEWSDLNAQIGFIDWELRNTEGVAGVSLSKTDSVAAATEVFLRQYERPADPDASLDLRKTYAINTFAKYQEILSDVQKSDEPENQQQEDVEQEGGIPLDPEKRLNYFAEQLDIPKTAIEHSSAFGGQNRFNINAEVGTKMLGVAAKGGYSPVMDAAPLDSMVDAWGMYSRECVSYTAWKVAHDKFPSDMPRWGGVDNQPDVPGAQTGYAKYWAENGRVAGYRVDKIPAQGSVIAWTTNGTEHSTYGHVAYVDKVLDDGSIVISQYNNAGTGEFSIEVFLPAYLDMVKDQIDFIHFEEAKKNDKSVINPLETTETDIEDEYTETNEDEAHDSNASDNPDKHDENKEHGKQEEITTVESLIESSNNSVAEDNGSGNGQQPATDDTEEVVVEPGAEIADTASPANPSDSSDGADNSDATSDQQDNNAPNKDEDK